MRAFRSRRRNIRFALLAIASLVAGNVAASDALPGVLLQPVFPNLDTRPATTAVPDNFAIIDARRVRLPTLKPGVASEPMWIVALRNGKMFVVRDASASAPGTPLLRDVEPTWASRELKESEEGFYAVAVDPDAGTNPTRAFAYYTLGKYGGVDLLRAAIKAKPRRGGGVDYTFGTPKLVLRIDGGSHHYGGHLEFGPEGYLYFSTGENEIAARTQSPNNTMGKLLRIDVHQSGLTSTYGVPADNPWRLDGEGKTNAACTNSGDKHDDYDHACPEVFAIGFRNPFRFSFDRTTGALWVGDVGASHEEIDRVTIGGNYGWDTCEGTTCDQAKLTPAVAEIPREGCTSYGYAIIGGAIYRGTSFPALQGKYIAGDNTANKLFVVDDPYGSPNVRALYNADCANKGFRPSAFSQDETGELYVTSLDVQPGQGVFRITRAK